MNALEQRALRSINAFRVREGLTTLMPNVLLEALAAQHAKDLMERNTLDHRRFAQRLASWSKAAENVAFADLPLDSPETVVKNWIGSPGHRKNMLGNFQFIGVARVASDKRAFWVTEFGS